jgi:hypothetical protein
LVAVGLAAATAAVIACWLPIFQVGGFIYRIVEEYRGHAYTVAAAIVPLCVAVAALVTRLPTPRTTRAAALAASAIAALAPVDHLTETLWRRKHPERFGSPFDIRYGYTVGLLAVAGGALVFAALVGSLLADDTDARRHPPLRRDPLGLVACGGLLLAVAGQLAESSTAHLWQLPAWPQVGRWWELVVTTALCGLAVVRRGGKALAAGFVAAAVTTIGAAERLSTYSAHDPAVSSTVTLVGFALLTVALAPAAADLVRGSPRR